MAIINRENVHVFAGKSNDPSDFGVIGSFAEGNGRVANTAPPPTEQVAGTQAFFEGLKKIVEDGNRLPTMEEFNSLFYAFTLWLKYLYQNGVPEWSAGEEYATGSMARVGSSIYAYSGNEQGSPPGNGWDLIASPDIITSLPDATELIKGILSLASSAEVTVGTVANKAVTPKSLKDSAIIPPKIGNAFSQLNGSYADISNAPLLVNNALDGLNRIYRIEGFPTLSYTLISDANIKSRFKAGDLFFFYNNTSNVLSFSYTQSRGPSYGTTEAISVPNGQTVVLMFVRIQENAWDNTPGHSSPNQVIFSKLGGG
jgi:hypothetical protein